MLIELTCNPISSTEKLKVKVKKITWQNRHTSLKHPTKRFKLPWKYLLWISEESLWKIDLLFYQERRNLLSTNVFNFSSLSRSPRLPIFRFPSRLFFASSHVSKNCCRLLVYFFLSFDLIKQENENVLRELLPFASEVHLLCCWISQQIVFEAEGEKALKQNNLSHELDKLKGWPHTFAVQFINILFVFGSYSKLESKQEKENFRLINSFYDH